MSLRSLLKVPKYALFYFDSDRTISVVPLKKIQKVINGDNVSKGSQVLLKYGSQTLEADIVAVNGMYFYLLTPVNRNVLKIIHLVLAVR